MNTYTRLLTLLDNAPIGTPEESAAKAIAVYLESGEFIEEIKTIQKVSKGIIEDIIAETGQKIWDTEAGLAQMIEDSVRIGYDNKKLDNLIIEHPELRDLLYDCRSKTKVAGSLRISAPKEKK